MSYKIRFFLPLAVAITGLSFLAIGAVQQLNRLSAYDPQIQIAEDVASALNSGVPAQAFFGKNKIDISKSLAPFVILYDNNGKPTSSSAVLTGQTPIPPTGVFLVTNSKGEDRLTWQPAPDTRIATIITKYNNGYVLAGRNMREAEIRIDRILHMVIFGWAVIMIATFVTVFIFIPESKPRKR